MPTAANRLDWVDAAKGLSIILVVMMHSAYGVGEDLGGTGVLHYIIGWATPFRMPEFFLISGLFLGQVIARPRAAYADRRIVHSYLVFAGGSELHPRGITMGYAALPVLHLGLGFIGSLAVCLTAALLIRLPWMGWLRWLGEHSIVVYLSFSIPMAATRTLLLKTGLITDVSAVSVIVMIVALLSPLVLYWLIEQTGWGSFLFSRPAWAHIPGTPGSRSHVEPAAVQPAE